MTIDMYWYGAGGMDNRVCLWDMQLLHEERSPPDTNTQQLPEL